MQENLFKITLADGTALNGLRLNGNNFVSETEVKASIFDGNLSRVTIEGPEDAEGSELCGVHGPMLLVEGRVQKWPDGYYFVLLDIPAVELEKMQLRGDIEYIAMMMSVELD